MATKKKKTTKKQTKPSNGTVRPQDKNYPTALANLLNGRF